MSDYTLTEADKLAALRAEHGLPATATPRELTDAMLARKALVQSFIAQHPNVQTHAAMLKFAEELGMTPEQYDPHGIGGYEWDAIYAAALKANHRYTRVQRTPTGGFILPAS